MWDQCKVKKGQQHSYSFTEPNEEHQARLEFENSEEFNKKLEVRHRVEEKNGNGGCGEYEEDCGFHTRLIMAFFLFLWVTR